MYRRDVIERLKAEKRTLSRHPRSSMNRVNDDELRRLWPTRLPDKELAARLGHDRGVIRRRAKTIGLKPRRVVWRELSAQEEMA